MPEVPPRADEVFASELRVTARLVSELRSALEAGLPAAARHLELLTESVDRLEAAAPELAGEISVELSAARLWIGSLNAARPGEDGRAAACRARGYLDKADCELMRLARLPCLESTPARMG